MYSPAMRSAKDVRSFQHHRLEYEFELRQVAESESVDSPLKSVYVLRSEGNTAHITLDNNLELKALSINGEDALPYVEANRITRQAKLLPSFFLHLNEDELRGRIFAVVKSLAHHKTSEQTVQNVAESLVYGNREFVLAQLRASKLGDIGDQKVKKLSADSLEIVAIQKALFAIYFEEICDVVNVTLSATFSNVRYITPLRASAERYYRQRAVAVDEIAPNGENIAMFLRSLSHVESAEFASWTAEHMGFSVLVETHTGHVSILIEDQADRSRVNLADVGFGYSQVIPILAQVWQISRRQRRRGPSSLMHRDSAHDVPIFFLIEQPELHLHPKMQSRLMDLFCKVIAGAKASGVDLRVIIETHSETMVARVGSVVAQHSMIEPTDVAVYLFEKQGSEGGSAIVRSEFDRDGFLINWPYDFFDGSKL